MPYDEAFDLGQTRILPESCPNPPDLATLQPVQEKLFVCSPDTPFPSYKACANAKLFRHKLRPANPLQQKVQSSQGRSKRSQCWKHGPWSGL